MPSSHFHLIPTIIATVGRYPTKEILDIGCGSGKYGVLIKEYITPNIDAIEANKKYANQFIDSWLYSYRTVELIDVMEYDFSKKKYDLYLLLNIIDHLTREDALTVMDRIQGDMLIAVPQTWYQDDHEDIWEKHKSFWKKEDFDELFGSLCQVEHIMNPFEGQLTDNMILIHKGNASMKWNGEKFL